MVQRLFADILDDAIWFMNIHEQNHPRFLAMTSRRIEPVIIIKTDIKFNAHQFLEKTYQIEKNV